MKKILIVMLAVGLVAGFAFTAFTGELKTKETVTGEGIKGEKTTTVTTSEGAVTVEEKEKVKTPAAKEKMEKETVVTSEGAATGEKIKIKEKGVGKEKVEAGAVETAEGEKAEAAKVTLKRKGMKKDIVTFDSFDDTTMTVTVIKGGAKVQMPTREHDKWEVHPTKMKKGQQITIYSTYDPNLVKHVVQDAEMGKIMQ
ncbi:MAG: hypothetical protein ABH871_08810 [Pseudomonadota bacterium]